MQLPSPEELKKMMLLVRNVVFPEVFGMEDIQIEIDKKRIYKIIASESTSKETAQSLIDFLPELRRLLLTDVEAVTSNDPAVTSKEEVVLCYPLIKVMLNYRTAHFLLRLGVPLIPRVITELAHGATGIDIHPAASIGEYFCIDHGTGTVVGATCIIGNHVTLYQGVTLGARNFKYDDIGHPIDLPRHPILEDNVTVYSNTSILGRVTIGHDTVVGGNVWLTHDIPPHSKVLQGKPEVNVI